MSTLKDILTLDVGGTQFVTTRSTLVSEPDSMLARMFDPDSELEAGAIRNGAVFLDRDGEQFRHVLFYLRNRRLGRLTDSQLEELLCEAEYFGLAGLLEIVQERLNHQGDIVYLNVGGELKFRLPRRLINKFPEGELFKRVQEDGARDRRGHVFVDADPECFRHVLQYMRTGRVTKVVEPDEGAAIFKTAEDLLNKKLVLKFSVTRAQQMFQQQQPLPPQQQQLFQHQPLPPQQQPSFPPQQPFPPQQQHQPFCYYYVNPPTVAHFYPPLH